MKQNVPLSCIDKPSSDIDRPTLYVKALLDVLTMVLNYFGVLVFEVLVFEVLVFEVLVFEVVGLRFWGLSFPNTLLLC